VSVTEKNWAVITPLANESGNFHDFARAVTATLDRLGCGTIYLVVDHASKDNTLDLVRAKSASDSRFVTVWAPENKNVVDAYIRGLREAYAAGHEFIVEMDAGLSHDPGAIPIFLRILGEGNECAFGSRFTVGGSMTEAPWTRKILSRGGTIVTNLLLGTQMSDMTSGFQAFHREVLESLLSYSLLSEAHFYQTELRYLLRKRRFAEVPIHYRTTSRSVSQKAITNSITTLLYYFLRRATFRAASL